MIPLKLLLTMVTIALSTSFQFGYQTGCLNAPSKLIISFIEETLKARGHPADEEWAKALYSFCVTGFLVGGLAGVLSGGILANKLGRKRALDVLSIPSFIGCILMMIPIVAKSFELIIVGRFILGISCGAYSVIGPMYLSEVASTDIRGAAGSSNQFVIVIAILFSQILGLSQLLGTAKLWPYLIAFNIIANALQVILLRFIPESPRYLYLAKGDKESATAILQQIRSPSFDIEAELEEMENESKASAGEKGSIKSLFTQPYLRATILIAILAQLCQQFSGINAVIYYSVIIYEQCGLNNSQAIYANLGSGLVAVLITMGALVLIDKYGRRKLLLGGGFGMLMAHLIFTLCNALKDYANLTWPVYISVAATYFVVGFFGLGPGPIPWFLVAELVTQSNRDAAMTVSAVTNWLANIVVGLLTPQFVKPLGAFLLMPFAVALSIALILLAIYQPESKGKSASDTEQEMIDRYGRKYSGNESDVELSVT